MKEYFFSGTLGDAFVAFCKLSTLDETVKITRICNVPGVNHLISELSLLFPNIIFNNDYRHFESIEAMRDFAFAQNNRYINIFWDGDGRSNEPDDPTNIGFEPYPQLNLPSFYQADQTGLKIGIQLHSGARQNYQRAIDVDWIIELVNASFNNGYAGEIEIHGTGTGYQESELELLRSIPKVTVKVGKLSLTQWLSSIADLDFFISPEGLSAFFALSRKVPTLNIYEDRAAIQRMPKEWRNLATSIVPEKKIVTKTMLQRYIPLAIPQTLAIIHSTINPDIS